MNKSGWSPPKGLEASSSILLNSSASWAPSHDCSRFSNNNALWSPLIASVFPLCHFLLLSGCRIGNLRFSAARIASICIDSSNTGSASMGLLIRRSSPITRDSEWIVWCADLSKTATERLRLSRTSFLDAWFGCMKSILLSSLFVKLSFA